MRKALVVLSGGQDSATCMAWAANRFDEVETISFNYGQRHARELESAKAIAALFDASHQVIDIPVLKGNKASALTSDGSVSDVDLRSELPKSFVPGRNLIFLTSAASIALSQGIEHLVTGVCQTDYSGYPDCRRDTIDALQTAINLGSRGLSEITIHTPLMYLTKAQTVELARSLKMGWEAVALSWTCYEGGEAPCGKCPACELRAKGFAESRYRDPALK